MTQTMNGPHKYEWTRFEINFMRAHFMHLNNRQLSEMIGHRNTLVRTKCYELGLKRMEMEYWTDVQVKFLLANYKEYGDTELAEMFDVQWQKDKGWTKKHIEKKRLYLKLVRTSEEKKAIHSRNVTMGRFADCPVKRWETMGVTPVGERRMWTYQSGRKFMVIKLKDGFVHYAQWLYEQIYGAIPEGMVCRMKDDNPDNVVPGNLELITRAEHGRRNGQTSNGALSDNYIVGILSYKNKELKPEIAKNTALIEVKRLQLTLKRTINERKNNKEDKQAAQ